MMKFITLFFLILMSNSLIGQQRYPNEHYMSQEDSIKLLQLETLTLPEIYKQAGQKDLPDYHNNSLNPYFRPVFNQFGWSCGQASTIGYNFTYEFNRVNNSSAALAENQFAPAFQYNFFNHGESGIGVCYLHTMEAIQKSGTPNVVDYGGMGESLTLWPDGYDLYYNAMHNRISQIYSIPVGTEEGLLTLKHWLYDHLNGSEFGGLANFYTDLSGFTNLPPDTPDEGKAVITQFGSYSGHSMTFIGWNDSIRWDYNEDGQYTNDLDINGDGEVTMKDWEIGGLILANSWGDGWADSGFCYVMYNVVAMEKFDGGIWNKQVNVFDVKADYEPSLAFKIRLKHNSRNKIKVMAGVSTDTSSTWPDHFLEFPIFNYQGGDFYMQGDNSSDTNKTLNFGLDVTPLLSFIESDEPAKFFCLVTENDPQNEYTGTFRNFSLMDYTNGVLEISCSETEVPLIENGTTSLTVNHSVIFDPVTITTLELPGYDSTQTYSTQLEATGGKEPYNWSLAPVYLLSEYSQPYIPFMGTILQPSGNNSGQVMQALDFEFPFYDQVFDSITVHVDGFLMFRYMPYPLPYQVNDLLLLKQERMIAPFLNKDIYLNTSAEDHIWYDGDENHAAFRWKATIENGIDDFPIDFTTILYPDGKIAFYIDETSFPTNLISRVCGISAGDGKTYQLTESTYIPPNKLQSQVSTFVPQNYPSQVSISPSGELNFSAQNHHNIYSVNIRVTDMQDISDIKPFPLSSGLNFTYNLHDGEDNLPGYGDTLMMDIEVKNTGTSVLSDINLTFNCNDPYVILSDSLVNFGNLNAGESVIILDAYTLILDPVIPDQYVIQCLLHFESGENYWDSPFSMTAIAPELDLISIRVNDENQRPDPGETVYLQLGVNNTGHSPAKSVNGILQTNDPYIIINGVGGVLDFGDIPVGGIALDSLSITIDEDCPQGHLVNFEVSFAPESAPATVEAFSLLIGRFPVLLVDLDPENISGVVINDILTDLNVLHDYHFEIPNDLDEYQNIFVFLGRKFSNHVLSETEGDKLAGFLTEGGNIYLEGGQTWYDDPATAVHPYFHVVPEYLNWNNYDSIAGFSGSFADSIQMYYNGSIAYYDHQLMPQEFAIPLLYSSSDNHTLTVAYQDENYKTIASIFDFGALVDEGYPSTKTELLSRILTFFDVEIILTTVKDNTGNLNKLSCFPNPTTKQTQLLFHSQKTGIVDFMLYSVRGDLVFRLPHKQIISAGENSITIDLSSLPAGIYFGCVKMDNQDQFIKIIKH